MNDRDVRMMQAVAYVMAQTVAATARIEGMKATNLEKKRNGYALAYDGEAFEGIITEFGLGHNNITAIWER